MNPDYQQVYTEDYYKVRAYEHGNLSEHFGLLARSIKQHINPHLSLDVGCARGYFVQAMHELGIKAYGMDISEYAINNCTQGVKQYLALGNAEEQFPDSFDSHLFDVVTCMECIEHLDRPWQAIAEMVRVLRPHGYIVIASPKMTVWRILFNLVYGQAEVHPSEFNLAVWIELFGRHRLQYMGDFAREWGIASELRRMTIERTYKMMPCTSTGRLLNRLGKWGRWLRVQLNVLVWEPEYMLFRLR